MAEINQKAIPARFEIHGLRSASDCLSRQTGEWLLDEIERMEAVVEEARKIDFVFSAGGIEQIAHRSDFRGLHDALVALDSDAGRETDE